MSSEPQPTGAPATEEQQAERQHAPAQQQQRLEHAHRHNRTPAGSSSRVADPQSQEPPHQSQSPPRKRTRLTRGATQQDMIQEDATATNTDSNAHAHAADKMKMKHRGRRGGRGRGGGGNAAPAPATTPPVTTTQPSAVDSDESGEDGEVLGVTERLVRRVPRRPGLGNVDQEVIRLIGQHLNNIGLKTSAEVLMAEAGCRLDQPTAAAFKKWVLAGDWTAAVNTLSELQSMVKKPEHITEMKFLLLEQKYLELISRRQPMAALKVLQQEISTLNHNQSRTHRLSSYLMLSAPDEIAAATRPALGGENARMELMERLQEFLPANIMLPPKRLTTLLEQAALHQTRNCLFHNRPLSAPSLDTSYLSVDHTCPKDDFPSETLQVLTAHCEEAWYVKWSPDGRKLASGSKDNVVVIWNYDPETQELTVHRELDRHNHGAAYFAWSPDSSKLAVCGPEEGEECACIWDVDTGSIHVKLHSNSDDAPTYVAFSPDGSRVVCGGSRGQFFTCDEKGDLKDTWEGIRVQGLHFRADGKHVLASDTHHRLRSYNFEDLTDRSLLQEEQAIMSFCVDKTDRYALLNIANQGLHLWDLNSRTLIRKFPGITQGFYTLYSTLGGTNESFIASGSEDNKVYIYHREHEEPIQILSGHTRTVNCVSWNPVYPKVLVSASDDTTLRLWGPAQRYRTGAGASTNGSSINGATNGNATNGVANGN